MSPPGQPIHRRSKRSVGMPSSAATRPPELLVIVSPTVTGKRLETLMIRAGISSTVRCYTEAGVRLYIGVLRPNRAEERHRDQKLKFGSRTMTPAGRRAARR